MYQSALAGRRAAERMNRTVSVRAVLLDIDLTPGLPVPPGQPGVKRSSLLGSLFQSKALQTSDFLECRFFGRVSGFPGQLPEVEGGMKCDVSVAFLGGKLEAR